MISYIAVILVISGATYFFYRRRSKETSEAAVTASNSYEWLSRVIITDLAEIVKPDRGIIYRDADYEASRRTKLEIENASKTCSTGDENAKAVMMQVFRDIIAKHLPDLESCNRIIDFSDLNSLTPEQKWEILVYFTRRKWKKRVIWELNRIYHFTTPRTVVEGDDFQNREIDYVLLDKMFEEQCPVNEPITYEEALDLLAIFQYATVKGAGKIETLCGLDIDGLELGTVGSIRHRTTGLKTRYVVERSCSIQIEAVWVHLSFIDFGSVNEIKRLILNLTNVEGFEALTIKNPLKVVDDYEGSRLTAIRPDSGDTWGLFKRSFSAGILSTHAWLASAGVGNADLVEELVCYLAKAYQNLAITGEMNCGKTTFMKGVIGMYPAINIRVLEQAFELNLREAYPYRNIFTVKPTEYVDSAAVQAILKKTDGLLSCCGEIADNMTAVHAMTFGQVASAASIFTHHGNTTHGTIDGLTGAMLSSGVYSDEKFAQSVVLDVVKHNIHLEVTKGRRIVGYIDEVVSFDNIAPYPVVKHSSNVIEAIDQVNAVNKVFYERSTDRERYTTNRIIEYDPFTNSYQPVGWYTKKRFAAILEKLQKGDEATAKNFVAFYKKNFEKFAKPDTRKVT